MSFFSQDEALKDPYSAYKFAYFIPGADIYKCQEVVCKDPQCAYYFACDIPGADIDKCLEACKGTRYEDMLNEYFMKKALM